MTHRILKTFFVTTGTAFILCANNTAFAAAFSVTGTTVNESDGTAVVNINLSEASTQATEVSFATGKDTAINGSDFFGSYQQIQFAPGETVKSVAVKILDDTAVEGDERFIVRIFTPSAGIDLDQKENFVNITDDDSDDPDPIDPQNDVSLPGLPSVSDAAWDDGAVRRILHNFAYGGYASDSQIRNWADMKPWAAIKQILNFNEHNLRVSPRSSGDPDNLTQVPGTLDYLGNLWQSDDLNNATPWDLRERYGIEGWNLQYVWMKAALARGLNPVRQKIGLWETNFHMAVNRDAGLYGPQIVKYYDTIMNALNGNEPYHAVIAKAAASSAVAEQYKHKENRWVDGACECNEDFSREFHQLFFGILGEDDRNKHETVTIKNTAKILTDMDLPWLEDLQSYDPIVRFGSEYHHRDAVTVLDTEILASNTALPKINQLASRAIKHPESLANLPVKIVSQLMDDNLQEASIQAIRQAWGAMESPNLLRFLRAYTISVHYHNPDRVKYWTSVDRHAILSSRMSFNNNDVHLDIYDPFWSGIHAEKGELFAPSHNVFGDQSGIEAARSASVFQNNFNLMTDHYWRFYNPEQEQYGKAWRKDWAAKLPKSADGNYRVKDIAPWLWNYVIGDGLKNFGPLERAIVYAELAGPESLQFLLDRDSPNRVIRSADIENDPQIRALVTELGDRTLALNANDLEERERANGEVGTAVNFISATPYIFAQQGR